MDGWGDTWQQELLVASKFLLVMLLNLGPAEVIVRRERTLTCMEDPDPLLVSKSRSKEKWDDFKGKD